MHAWGSSRACLHEQGRKIGCGERSIDTSRYRPSPGFHPSIGVLPDTSFRLLNPIGSVNLFSRRRLTGRTSVGAKWLNRSATIAWIWLNPRSRQISRQGMFDRLSRAFSSPYADRGQSWPSPGRPHSLSPSSATIHTCVIGHEPKILLYRRAYNISGKDQHQADCRLVCRPASCSPFIATGRDGR